MSREILPEPVDRRAKFLAFAMVTAILLAAGDICFADPSEIQVGSEVEFRPYAFVDKQGDPAGFSVDLIKAIADAMGWRIKISTGSWDDVWKGLLAGQIDVLPIVAVLPERQQIVDFSLPHTETYDAFFVREGRPVFNDLASARGKQIVVMRSDAAHHELQERQFDAKLILVKTIPEGLKLVASGKHDGFLCSKLIGTLEIRNHDIKGLYSGPPVKDYTRVFSFAVRKGNHELLEKLNQGLLIIKSNGEYDRIYRRWLTADDPWRRFQPYVRPAIVTVLAFSVIVVAAVVILQWLVRERTRELAHANQEIQELNRSLEERVEERTAELETANASLEQSRRAALGIMEDAVAARKDVERVNAVLRNEIAERIRTEELLRESEARFRTLVTGSGPIVFRAARDGSMLDAPGWEVVTGQPREAYCGQGWLQRVHPEDLGPTTLRWSASLASSEPAQMNFRISTRGGQWRWVHAYAVPVRAENGGIIERVGTITDIHDRYVAQQAQRSLLEERGRLLDSERCARNELERANRLKDEFLANLSHELRTPLNAILGWTQILRRRYSDAASVSKGLEVIERNTRIQVQLISDLLDISRILSGKMRLETRSCDPGVSLEGAIDSLAPAAEAKSIKIDRLIEPVLGTVLADPDRLQQAFWNLLSNAIKFTPAGGYVQIIGRRKDSQIEIEFRDTGRGIRPDFLPHVFERFRQADSSSTKSHAGLGLGLALVQHLVELHGGVVKAESPGEEQGATFTITLPVLAMRREGETSAASKTCDALGREDIALNGLKVLFVDDDSDTRSMIKRLLEEHGATVTVADSAETGIAALQGCKPDLLIGDIGMPGEDGYEMISRIRSLEPQAGAQITAIALTAYSRDEDRARAIRAGYQYHLAKPVEAVELLATVGMILQGLPQKHKSASA